MPDDSEEEKKTTRSLEASPSAPSTPSVDCRVPSLFRFVPLKGIVRIPFTSVQYIRTESEHCTEIEHLGRMEDVKIDAHQVVQRYVVNLRLTGRFQSIEALSKAMVTSRTQVYEMFTTGKMMTKHVNGLALAMETDLNSVYAELGGLAKNMQDGVVHPVTREELATIIKKRPKKKRGATEIGEAPPDQLRGAAEKHLFSADRPSSDDAPSGDSRGTSKRSGQRQKHPDQNKDRQR